MMRNFIVCRLLLAKFIAMIKSGMRWAGHVTHMEQNRDVFMVVV